jgi:hypothetical protein
LCDLTPAPVSLRVFLERSELIIYLTPLTPSPFKEKAMERGRSRRASLPLQIFFEREIAERSSDEGEVNTLGFPETL